MKFKFQVFVQHDAYYKQKSNWKKASCETKIIAAYIET